MGSTSDGDRPWQSYHTVYTNAKAGMDGVDKEKVQRTVYEMSKGSKYFESEKRKEAVIKQKVENLRAQCAELTEKDICHFQTIADTKFLELEASRDLSKIWLHSDMDAFYAAVETLENPSLKGKPLAVGSMSMICTANYEARKFGVRAAMPGFIARKLCPDLVFVPTNFEKYTHYSELTRKVFRKYDPYFIATSLDEAYLNITGTCEERGISSEEIANELRNAIYEETGLTCSAGVAPNRLLAKVCSDINKPNGQFILANDRKAVMTFVSSLPIRKIGGIGKVTEHVLKDVLGIITCEEMLQKGAFLCALFSHCSTAGLGLGRTDTPQFMLRKSISSERTFSATADEPLLFQKLGLRMSQFRDDKHGPSDPTQKTLTSFVISGDIAPSVACANNSTDLGISDELVIPDYELDDLLESNQLALVHKYKSSSDADRIKKRNGDDCSAKSKTNSPGEVNGISNSVDEAVPFSSQNMELQWVDGYICSVCGAELPPSFIDERQEHFDYHLAETLQKEESVHDARDVMQLERSVQKTWKARESARKKQKSSPKERKHIPIDAFFARSNKNL